jgi:anaerobic selenocysteine-containing dehydrogenase
MQTITRRDFLKTTGFVTAATLMGEGLAEAFAGGKAFKGGQRAGAAKKPPPFNLGSLIEQVPTACWIGKQDCVMWAWKTTDGRVIKLEGHLNDPRTAGALCPKGQAQLTCLYDPYRVKAPLKRTNAKGQTGTWVEISWDQALNEIAAQMLAIKNHDIRRFIFQRGRNKAGVWHYDSFNAAFGTKNKYGHGATCSDAGYRASELIFDTHACAEVDFKYCNYLLCWGWNILRGGGPHLCQIGWPQQLFDAKQRGMKVVVIDPQIRGVGHFADEWIPIQPGHDLAFWLAMANVLVEMGYVDEEYLKKFTNAPCLVGPDGLFLRQDGEELVWDRATGAVRKHSQAADPDLFGNYQVNGAVCRPAFDLYVQHIQQYTPEWAEGKCGVSAATIRRLATEFGENAQIGATMNVGGVELPYRPAAIGYYHCVQQEMGAITAYAAYHVTMLVGSVDVVGGTRARNGSETKPAGRRAGMETLATNPGNIKNTPDGPSLDGSKFFPIGSGGYTLTPLSLSNPQKYGLPYPPEQLLMWIQMANPVMSSTPRDVVINGLSKVGTVVVVDAFLSETADLCADYVLPAGTLDKYEGPLGGFTGYETLNSLRMPIVEPMFESKADAEIYIEMAERLGIRQKYVQELNTRLGLTGGLTLDPSQKPTVPDTLDRWAKSKGKDLNWFQQNGALVKEMPVTQWYARLWTPAYGGRKHAFYSEVLLRIGREVVNRGVNAPYVADYNAFPIWREPTMDSSPSAYDLTLISHKKIEHKQSRTAHNVLLNMLDPDSPLLIHPQTAADRGISDGDVVWVESHNALTGETRQVQARAKVILGIMPGVVAMAHHHGNFSHPVSQERDRGASPNVVFPSGEGYVDITGNQAFQVRVGVWKA